jgi:hypothetical protein
MAEQHCRMLAGHAQAQCTMRSRWSLALAFVSACAASPDDAPTLGIARFDVRETAEVSTVVGTDAQGREIARMELVHGPFTLTGIFAENAAEPHVMGRKLDVLVLGQQMHWETAGFQENLHMPPHPASHWAVAAFLADGHVKPVLDEWKVGFENVSLQTAVADWNDAYTAQVNGSDVLNCSGAALAGKCPLLYPSSQAPNICNGSLAVADLPKAVAYRLHQRRHDAANPLDTFTGYFLANTATGTYDQSFIAQCCPTLASGAPPLFAVKACPDGPNMVDGVAYPTTCGASVARGKCAACAAYGYPQDTNGKCDLQIVSSGASDPLALGDDKTVYDARARYAWTCGDGFCDLDETCSSCEADCGCAAPDTCGGAGAPDVCGCTPITACPAGWQCGAMDDGCGGTIDCGGGRSCDEIVGKKHYTCVAADHRCCKHGRCHDGDDAD